MVATKRKASAATPIVQPSAASQISATIANEIITLAASPENAETTAEIMARLVKVGKPVPLNKLYDWLRQKQTDGTLRVSRAKRVNLGGVAHSEFVYWIEDRG